MKNRALRSAVPTPRFIIHEVESGDMSPTVEAGDLAEIDTTITMLPRTGRVVNEVDGVYLLAFPNGNPALRRIRSSPTDGHGLVRVYCDRDAGRRDSIDIVEEHRLKIIGRATRVMNIRRV